MIPFLYEQRELGPTTFAAPDEGLSFSEGLAKVVPFTPIGIRRSIGRDIDTGEFGRLFGTAERQTRLVETAFSQDAAREEAYDRRIKAVKDTTGIALENPERGGYSLSGVELRRLTRDGPIDPAQERRHRFDRELGKAMLAHPDKTDALTFGNIDEEAKAIAKGADDEYEAARHDSKASTAGSLAAGFTGGLWGMRRDPLFVGSMFLGPTGAFGRTVAARIATSGLMQGAYNAGITALEQPPVQAWRADLGLKSGVQPALEHVGLAFLFGAIPGAALRGLHEATAARPAIERVLRGEPEAGDIERAVKATGGEMTPQESAAVKLGDEMDAADKATRPPPAKDISPELHDDLTAAAQRKADDPGGSPSPEAVAATREPEKLPTDISERITAAAPQTEREAQMVADEAIDDAGRRQGMTVLRDQIEEGKGAYTPEAPAEPSAKASKDPLDKIPMAREDGTPTLVSPRTAARAGERETQFAELIRSCA